MAKKRVLKAAAFVLMSAADINGLIDKAVATTKKGIALIHQAAVQCLAHAEKHGDITLLERLVQEVKDNCEGYVVAGLRFWIEQNSPVKLSVNREGKVSAKLLKEDDEGFKPFDVEGAAKSPAHQMQEVRDRSNRKIEPLSVTSLKANIARLARMVESASKDDGRGFLGDTPEQQAQTKHACEVFVKRMTWAMDNIKLTEETAPEAEPAKEKAAA